MDASMDHSGLQPTSVSACLRCRRQKLRCSRERPQCRRCHRIGAECSYPAPPDRKRLAAERAEGRSKSANTETRSVSVSVPAAGSRDRAEHSEADVLSSHRISQIPRSGSPHERPTPPGVLTESSLGEELGWLEAQNEVHLSQEVALFLIEVYFQRHYQAHLLFNKSTFAASFLSGKIPRLISLSVFALATLFLDGSPEKPLSKNITIGNMSETDWTAVGEQWANQASKMALMNADRPCLEHVQACQILAMFWYARGETARTNMHTSIAYRTCCLLKFDQADDVGASGDLTLKQIGNRCLWACWLTKCASQRNAHFQGDCWKDFAYFPLPSDDDELEGDPRRQRICFDEYGKLQERSGNHRRLLLGPTTATIIIFGIWWEIQDFVRNPINSHKPNVQSQSATLDAPEWIGRMYELDRKLQDFYDATSEDLRYGTDTSAVSAQADPYRSFCVTYIYHLCICYLHSSIVPALSGKSQRPTLSKQWLRVSAEKALHHSTIMTNMTNHFMSTDPDLSKLWPIVGYGASVCLAIQLRHFIALRTLDRERLNETQMHLRLANGLKKYWVPLRGLAAGMERFSADAGILLTSVTRPRVSMDAQGQESRHASLDRLVTKGPTQEMAPCDIYTYVADEDRNTAPEKLNRPQQDSRPATPAIERPPTRNRVEVLDQAGDRSQYTLIHHSQDQEQHSIPTPHAPHEAIWWDQDPMSLGLHCNSLLLSDIVDMQMEMY